MSDAKHPHKIMNKNIFRYVTFAKKKKNKQKTNAPKKHGLGFTWVYVGLHSYNVYPLDTRFTNKTTHRPIKPILSGTSRDSWCFYGFFGLR